MPVENSRRSGPGRGPVTFSNVPTHVDPGRADPGRSKLPRYARRSGPRSGRSWSAIRARRSGPADREPSRSITTQLKNILDSRRSGPRSAPIRAVFAITEPRSARRGPRRNRGDPRILARRSRTNARAGVLLGSRACAGFSRTISRKNNLKSRKKIAKIHISWIA